MPIFQGGVGSNLEKFPYTPAFVIFELVMFVSSLCTKFNQNPVVIAHFTVYVEFNKTAAAAVLEKGRKLLLL